MAFTYMWLGHWSAYSLFGRILLLELLIIKKRLIM
uniref:Uncharacterized protein n=1 Tax=Rhizophora mucronata TaxID=61149 RepID=A0A2P2N262_RHIMU